MRTSTSATSGRRTTVGRWPVAAAAALSLTGVLAASVPAAAQPPGGGNYPTSKTISWYRFHHQSNGYYCGPASTRLALTSWHVYKTQVSLAHQLGTTSNGTDNIGLVTKVLDKDLAAAGKPRFYETKMIYGNTASSAAVKKLKADILYDVSHNVAIVANVISSAEDTAGHWHSYGGGHYLTVVGYTHSGNTAIIEDVAVPTSGRHKYAMTTSRLATWIASKGYSA